MKPKTKRRKTSKKIWVLLALLVLGVITAIGVYQIQPKPAHVYFEIVSAGWDGPPPELIQSGSEAIIYGLAVTFKAVGGDAHDVIIQSWAYSEPEDIGTMQRDVPITSILSSTHGYHTRREVNPATGGEGYPVEIRIYSQETSTVKIKFYILI